MNLLLRGRAMLGLTLARDPETETVSVPQIGAANAGRREGGNPHEPLQGTKNDSPLRKKMPPRASRSVSYEDASPPSPHLLIEWVVAAAVRSSLGARGRQHSKLSKGGVLGRTRPTKRDAAS